MVSLRKRFRFGGLLGATTLLAACGGGVTDPLSDSALKLIGKAIVGQLSSGSVSAYAVNEDGSNGPLLGTGQTDGNGEFDVTLTSKPSGGVRLVVNGGSYASPANTTTTVHDATLSAVLSALSVTGASGVVVSPFTSFADPLLVSLLSSAGSLSAAQTQADGVIKTSYGIQSTNPLASLAPDFTATSGDSAKLALVLGALEQLAITNGKTPNEIFHAIGEDITDGLFDGKTKGGVAIRYNSTAAAPATLGNDQFLSAVTRYTAPSNTSTILAKNNVVLESTMVTALQGSITANSADTAPPTVLSVSPAKNATGAAYNGAVTVSFSEPMIASSINSETFTVAGATGTVTYSGTTATFTPTGGFAGTKTYTATVTTGAKDAAGNPLANAYTWTFTTGVIPDTTRPTVTSTTSANNATGIALNAAITATFSEAMTASTINATNFTVDGVAGTVSLAGKVATFRSTANLAYGTPYTARIGTGVKDAAGNPLAEDYLWHFTTRPVGAGDLDVSFNGTGRVVTTSTGAANAAALQTDQKIVVAGTSGYPNYAAKLARYNSNGSLDATFGTSGKVSTTAEGFTSANAVAVQPDGKIIAAGSNPIDLFSGSNAFKIARFNPDGNLDTNFGVNGIATTGITTLWGFPGGEASAVAVQSDGKIVAVGADSASSPDGLVGSAVRFVATRYNSNGSPDSAFGKGGIANSILVHGLHAERATAVAIQSDGKIVAAGYSAGGSGLFLVVVRYKTDGTFDTTFGSDGIVTSKIGDSLGLTSAYSIAIQTDGKIIVGGQSSTAAIALVRYSPAGALDSTFGSGGIAALDVPGSARSVAIQTDGKIIVTSQSAVLRYTSDGHLDTAFGTSGRTASTINPRAILIQTDGKIVAAGASGSSFNLERYIP